MNKISLLLALLFCVHLQAQRKPKIKGNKNVVEVKEALPAFHAIELKDDLDIDIQYTGEEGYTLLADDNLIDVLKFTVKDSTLYISSFYRVTSKKKLDITINYHSLNAITVLDGRIRMNNTLNSNELSVATFDSAKLDLNANVSLLHLNMEGNSSGDFTIESDSLNIALKDRIDLKLYATSPSIVLDMQGNSSLKMDGTTTDFHINLGGNATLKSEKLQATTIKATLIGSPSAKVNTQGSIELDSRGSSKTYVHGAGEIVLIDFLDTSELLRRKN